MSININPDEHSDGSNISDTDIIEQIENTETNFSDTCSKLNELLVRLSKLII